MPRHYETTDKRRRQIAEIALELIAVEGLGGFTTRAIASRMGINDGSIFRHFKNKQEIVLAAMERLEEELFATSLFEPELPFERLEVFFRTRATLLGGPRAVGRLVFSSMLVHAAGEPGVDRYRSWRARSMEFIREQLSALARAGELRVDLPQEDLARLVLGALLVFANERILAPDGIPDLPARIERAWSALETILTAKGPPS